MQDSFSDNDLRKYVAEHKRLTLQELEQGIPAYVKSLKLALENKKYDVFRLAIKIFRLVHKILTQKTRIQICT